MNKWFGGYTVVAHLARVFTVAFLMVAFRVPIAAQQSDQQSAQQSDQQSNMFGAGSPPLLGESGACVSIETHGGSWLDAALRATLPADAGAASERALLIDGTHTFELRNQSDRPEPPYLAASLQTRWWYDLRTGDVVVERGPGPAQRIPPQTADATGTPRRLIPWAVLHDWAASDSVRVSGRCDVLGYPRIVLERAGPVGEERLVLDAASAVPVALVRTEVDPLLGPERAEYRYQGWWGPGEGRYPTGSVRVLDGRRIEARTAYPASVRLVPRDSVPEAVTVSPSVALPEVDTIRVGSGTFLLKSARFTEAVTLQGDTVYLMDAAAGTARARADSAWIARLFPGRHPVTVIVPSLAWPHFLGVRYWAARGARIVTHALGVPLLREALNRRWDAAPDLLDEVRDSVAPRVEGIDTALEFSGGRVLVSPVRGVTGEAGLFAYVRPDRFLWASDRIQDVTDRNAYVEDLVWSVREAGLQPRTTSGPHFGAVSWKGVDGLVAGPRPAVPEGAWSAASSRSGTSAETGEARTLVLRAAEAMGGLDALRDLHGIRLKARYRENLVGTAADPSRPPSIWGSIEELRDPVAGASHEYRSLELVVREGAIPIEQIHAEGTSVIVRGGTQTPLPPSQSASAAKRLRLQPERLLATALEAPDLHRIPNVEVGGTGRAAVAFDGGRTRILFDHASHLPWAVEEDTVLTDDYTWSVWGDLTTRTVFGAWSLEPEGVRYPRMWTVERNGHSLRSVAVTDLDLSAPAPPDSFRILVEPEREAHDGGAPAPPARPFGVVRIRPGVHLLDGYFNVLLVAQEDGVVVIEPPHGSAYSEAVLAEAARLHPGLPVKAVVATSFLWPHLGGVRPYVARGVPIYLPVPNAETVRAMSRAVHTRVPDAQSRRHRVPILRTVRNTATIGTGPNRVELYFDPVAGGEHSRRMMVAYLPGRRLLHGGDLFLPERFEPTMWRGALTELVTIVRNRKLPVETVTALHVEETPWKDIEQKIQAGGM